MEWSESNPLMLEGWHEFNRIKWRVRPLRLTFGEAGGDGARLEAVLYLDRRGRVYLPHANPYLPVRFHPPPAKFASRVERRWLSLAEPLAAEMRARGIANGVDLPVGIKDARPWRWAGFPVGVKYTYLIPLPHGIERMEESYRTHIRRANRAGYRCERTDRLVDLYGCLGETAARKGFRSNLDLRDLEQARALLGDEHFRVYVCYAPDGQPAAANVVLHQPGGQAVGWVSGTASAHLSTGAAQLLVAFTLADLAAAGATCLDLAGGNIPGVARAKSQFGAALVPYFLVNPIGLKPLAICVLEWFRPAHVGARQVAGARSSGQECPVSQQPEQREGGGLRWSGTSQIP